MDTLQYDEDISANGYYQRLLSDHHSILETAAVEGWIVCVPRVGSFSDQCLQDQEFALAHVLVPNEELPETHFFNLNFLQLKLAERALVFGGMRVRILFEEIFYRDGLKYKVWCIERPLHDMKKYGTYAEDDLSLGRFLGIGSLTEAVEFIRTAAKKKDIFGRMDARVQQFVRANGDFGRWQFEEQKALVKMVYVECLDLILQNRKLKDRCQRDMLLRRNVKVAIETYVMDKLYDHVKSVIDVCRMEQAEGFNKTLRNLGDVHCTEFEVAQRFGDLIPLAKKELAKIDHARTVIDKIGCLQRVMDVLTKGNGSLQDTVTVDDLVPLFIFLILKSGLTHWMMTITFLKEFQFNNVFREQHIETGQHGFLIATLEAAIVYVGCGSITRTQRLGVNLDPRVRSSRSTGSSEEDEEEEDSLAAWGQFRNADDFLNYLLALMRKDEETRVVELLQDITNNQALLCNVPNEEAGYYYYLPSIDDQNQQGQAAIHLAAILGNAKLLTLILSLQPNVNAVDAKNWTALHYAAANGHQNLLLLLLHAGININSTSNDLHTSLHLACLNGHSGCVKALLYFSEHMRIYVDVNAATELGHTPLHYAAKWGFLDIVETLVEYSARVEVVNKLGATPLRYSHNVRITKLLVDALNDQRRIAAGRGPRSNGRPTTGYLVADELLSSQRYSDHDLLSEDAREKRTIEEMKRIEKALEAIAAQDTKLACVYLGIDGGKDGRVGDLLPSPRSDYEQGNGEKLCHPLCTCNRCVRKSSEFYNLLRKPFGSSAKPPASEPPRAPRLRLNLNAVNGEGYTALHVAAMHGNVEMVRVLLDEHVNPTIRLKSGATALHLATRERRLRIVRMLLARCPTADIVDLKDSRGDTPLHYAVEQNNLQLVQMLLEARADRSIRNLQGKRPIDIAKNNLYFNVVNLLEQQS
ncbi:ankyrin repeat domain-containing protein 27-like [Anopheles ziemanni]|uniref:ankyrin repeat domain-containing protein 27-like n=1 Tax=Anopheles coustani TaxID=139045 RepID=UPI00265A1EEC|nr:ankyrin repeat domain-containing protein 27-like [Anopheles coustani]XP_058169622.1 ankyrin repeat domain-containing protein 27-like [Anopheles ziemanni]